MRGNNEFHFNQATMQDIVQYYLDNVLLKGSEPVVTVKSIEKTSEMNETFVVKVSDREE